MYPNHTYGRVFKNKQATCSWVTGKLVSKMRKEGEMKHGDIVDYFKRKFGVHI